LNYPEELNEYIPLITMTYCCSGLLCNGI